MLNAGSEVGRLVGGCLRGFGWRGGRRHRRRWNIVRSQWRHIGQRWRNDVGRIAGRRRCCCCCCRRRCRCGRRRSVVEGAHRNAMQIAVADATAEAAFAAPLRVRLDGDLAAFVVFGVVHVHFQRPLLVRFDEREQVLAFVQHTVGADDVVVERTQTGFLGRRRRMDFLQANIWTESKVHIGYRRWRHSYQNVPHVLVGTLERAKLDANAEQALATPGGARRDLHGAHCLHFAAVHGHVDFAFGIRLEQLLQRVVVLIESRIPDGHDEIEERLQAGPLTRRIVLYLLSMDGLLRFIIATLHMSHIFYCLHSSVHVS